MAKYKVSKVGMGGLPEGGTKWGWRVSVGTGRNFRIIGCYDTKAEAEANAKAIDEMEAIAKLT